MAGEEFPQVLDLEEAKVHLGVLYERVQKLERLATLHDDEIEMAFRTPFWKRLWFRLDGWPLHRVGQTHELPWRPWRRS